MVQLGNNKRVLLLGGDGVVIYGPSGSGVEREASLAWDMPNFDELLVEALGKQNANKQVIVLFDGADQTYRKEENIPKLSAVDRPRFVKRKLELAFPNYPIRASIEIKPPKIKGRKSSAPASYLFVALPETDQVDRVGRAILESGVPVGGFGLLPAESVGLAPALAEKIFAGEPGGIGRWTVLIGQHETGGLRQVVVKDGNLALTRLTPTAEGGVSGAAWAEEVTREFRATMTYISRFGFNPDEGIDVIIISDDISRQFFDAQAMGVKRLRGISVSDALRLMGAKSFGLEKTNFADGLHAAWVSKKRALRLPIRVPSLHQIMAPRLAAQGAAIVLVFSALALVYMAFSSIQQNYVLNQEIEQRQSQRGMLERELAQESKVFDTLPIKANLLKGTLNVKNFITLNTVPVAGVFQRLKSVLGNAIVVNSIDYKHEPASTLQLEGVAGVPGAFVPPPPPGTVVPSERGLIKLSFTFSLPGSMPLEQKVNTAEALQKKLQEAFPGYAVKIDTQFGRVNREGRFEGNLTGAQQTGGGKEEAKISLEGPPL